MYTNSELESMIYAYRQGEPRASECLLSAFRPFLSKCVDLLLTGSWRIGDRSIERFLDLVFGAPYRSSAAETLRRAFRENYERDDAVQEVQIALLETCLQYT